MRSRVLFPLGALAAASAWCVVLLAVRKYEYGYAEYKGLVWNLALAWIPLGLAALLVVAYARRRSRLELAALRLRSFGFVFQQFNLIPTLTALENVEAKLAPAGGSRERALELLGEVGLAERQDHLPQELSGGEQQRVAIAGALSVEPRVVLADEPTGNLDTATGSEIIDLLAGLAEKHGSTVIVATHDATLAARAPRRIGMRDGRLLAAVPLTAA